MTRPFRLRRSELSTPGTSDKMMAKAAASDERVRQVMTTAGSPILYLDAPEFQRYVDADAAKMAEIVKKVGKLE